MCSSSFIALPSRRRGIDVALLVSLAILSGCNRENGKSDERAIAQAFAGPVTLSLREEISPASKTTSTVPHGEKLDVLQVRRRFVRVRTSSGKEGWTDSRHLLTAEQMAAIGELAKTAARLPSQGQATVYATLNVHTDPSRQSTSFFQITESMRVDVVAHRITPRAGGEPERFQVPKPPPPVRKRKPKKEPTYPPPPMPPAPGVPSNWIELSKTQLPPPPPVVTPPPPPPEAKVVKRRKVRPKPAFRVDDWYLVRTKEGKAGWVLAQMIMMAIPDEVAQYSEGARITSYFALHQVTDGDQKKNHWIWTTSREGQQPFQFDSFRVFTYVVRRHRYETAYIERDVEGYYPIEVTPGSMPKFSLILREEDGNLYRKTYVMEGYMVRKIEDVRYTKPVVEAGEQVISKLPEGDEKDAVESPSLADRIRNFFRRTGS